LVNYYVCTYFLVGSSDPSPSGTLAYEYLLSAILTSRHTRPSTQWMHGFTTALNVTRV